MTKKGTKKSKRAMTSNPEEAVDLISNMPDAILVLILSRLSSTEQVIQSSVFSRRWRHLWTAIPSLDLKIGYEKRSKTREFIEFVDWVLLTRSVDLDCLRLGCSDYYGVSTVWRWIHGAVMRNVKHLDLKFCPKEKSEDMVMPHCLVTCTSLEVLKLHSGGCNLRLPTTLGFPALRVLHLTSVDLPEDCQMVKDFFQSCPLLQDLTLSECCIWKLDLLCISCLKLKKLSITDMEYDGVTKCAGIKICCPKLVDLEISSHYTADNLFSERLDSLKKVVIESNLEGDTKSVLFPGISQVEYLSIDPFFFSQCIDAALDPALPNLKTLVLTTTMDDFSMDIFNQILKYYPKLESLELMIEQDFDELEFLEGDIMSGLTPDVKRVRFFEFNGEKPKVHLYEDYLEIWFSWGNEARF